MLLLLQKLPLLSHLKRSLGNSVLSILRNNVRLLLLENLLTLDHLQSLGNNVLPFLRNRFVLLLLLLLLYYLLSLLSHL